MRTKGHTALRFVDQLVADGVTEFTFQEAVQRLGRAPTATANMLRRLMSAGLIDRVRRGHYVVRQLGMLGTRAAAEDTAIAVAAAFPWPHRIAYRSALDENDLVTHPVRTLYVATTRRMRAEHVSGRRVHTVIESPKIIDVGAASCGPSRVSDLERSLLDAAARPELGGGANVLAEAIATAGPRIDDTQLTAYARELGWSAALRRIGSIADALEIDGLSGQLEPIRPLTADLDLEPGGTTRKHVWRDSRWHIRWSQSVDELKNVVNQ